MKFAPSLGGMQQAGVAETAANALFRVFSCG